MDELIREYIRLLNRYAMLQQSLAKSASGSFISLSRCRYNNIKLFTENFRTEFEAYITVGLSTSDSEKPCPTEEKEIKKTVGEADETDQQVVCSTEQDTDHKPSSNTAAAGSEKTTEDQQPLSNSGTWVSRTQKDKKKDPMRDIERLPSQSLRATQTSFKETIDQCITLANVYVELQQAENAIRQLRKEETQEVEALPLGELSVNEVPKEASAVGSNTPATDTDHIKAAGQKENGEIK